MPKYEVEIVRTYRAHSFTTVEVDAHSKEEARKIVKGMITLGNTYCIDLDADDIEIVRDTITDITKL